jgi:hypothetical protein
MWAALSEVSCSCDFALKPPMSEQLATAATSQGAKKRDIRPA